MELSCVQMQGFGQAANLIARVLITMEIIAVHDKMYSPVSLHGDIVAVGVHHLVLN